MERFLIIKQDYACQDAPTYILYKRISKWFGLKVSYKAYSIVDVTCNSLTYTFDNMNILVGMLIRHLYRKELKFNDVVDRKGLLAWIRNNTKIMLVEKTPFFKDKPIHYGEYTISEYFSLK